MKFLTISPYLAIYSEPLCATYASFGGGGSHIITLMFCTNVKTFGFDSIVKMHSSLLGYIFFMFAELFLFLVFTGQFLVTCFSQYYVFNVECHHKHGCFLEILWTHIDGGLKMKK